MKLTYPFFVLLFFLISYSIFGADLDENQKIEKLVIASSWNNPEEIVISLDKILNEIDNFTELAKILRSKKINLNIHNRRQLNALNLAAVNGFSKVVEFLLDFHFFDVNPDHDDGQTPLHIITRRGYRNRTATEKSIAIAKLLDIMRILLIKGTSIDYQTSVSQETALHYAARWGQYEMVKLLLRAGADKTLRDDCGRIAESHAYRHGFIELGDFIRDWKPSNHKTKDEYCCIS